MDFLDAQKAAADRLHRHAAGQGTDLAPFRNEYDVFLTPKRWIDFWLEDAAVGYHLCGEIGKLPAEFAQSQSAFRGIWDEAGSTEDLQQAWDLLRSWIIEAKEVDELTGRKIHRCML